MRLFLARVLMTLAVVVALVVVLAAYPFAMLWHHTRKRVTGRDITGRA